MALSSRLTVFRFGLFRSRWCNPGRRKSLTRPSNSNSKSRSRKRPEQSKDIKFGVGKKVSHGFILTTVEVKDETSSIRETTVDPEVALVPSDSEDASESQSTASPQEQLPIQPTEQIHVGTKTCVSNTTSAEWDSLQPLVSGLGHMSLSEKVHLWSVSKKKSGASCDRNSASGVGHGAACPTGSAPEHTSAAKNGSNPVHEEKDVIQPPRGHFLNNTIQPSNDYGEPSDSASSSVGSLDPDMLSIPSSSDGFQSQNSSGIGIRVFKAIFWELMLTEECRGCRAVEPGDGGDGGPHGSGGSESSPRESRDDTPRNGSGASSPTAVRTGKRQLCPDGTASGGQEDDGEPHRPPKRPALIRTSFHSYGPRYLACPFWKLDTTEHWECALRQIDTISHLKQHLSRRHTPTHYCQHCYGQFPDLHALDTHVAARSCARGSATNLGGISYDQRMRLSKKLAKGTEQAQWLAIWDILFHQTPYPSSIYIYPHNMVDVHKIREFSIHHGTGILAAELRANDLVLRPKVTDDQLQGVLRRGLSIMYEHYIGRHTATRGRASHHAAVHPGMSTSSSDTSMSQISSLLVESMPDSGLDLASASPGALGRVAGQAERDYFSQHVTAMNDGAAPRETINLPGVQGCGDGAPGQAAMEPAVEEDGFVAWSRDLGLDQPLNFEEISGLGGSWDFGRSLDELLDVITGAEFEGQDQ